ncbi:hypothetical protein HanOQP8_Chr15g0577491 [Helianthus annuus]|nr:hypothetical protein HanOQP8_Chr15g0577491 [Helianthus annuus]
MHFLFLYNTHLYSLHVKPDKKHNVIELGLSSGREGPFARKAPFVRKGPAAPTSLSPQIHPTSINRCTIHSFCLLISLDTLQNALKIPLTRSEALVPIFYNFPYIFLHFNSISLTFAKPILIEHISWMVFTSLLRQTNVETSPHMRFRSRFTNFDVFTTCSYVLF